MYCHDFPKVQLCQVVNPFKVISIYWRFGRSFVLVKGAKKMLLGKVCGREVSLDCKEQIFLFPKLLLWVQSFFGSKQTEEKIVTKSLLSIHREDDRINLIRINWLIPNRPWDVARGRFRSRLTRQSAAFKLLLTTFPKNPSGREDQRYIK